MDFFLTFTILQRIFSDFWRIFPIYVDFSWILIIFLWFMNILGLKILNSCALKIN